jgi:hypothetical protein
MLAVDRWIAICEKRLGREVKDLVLTTCEVNRDYDGCRLDGEVHCVSKKVFKDTLERVYQREDAVRHEFRLMKNMTLTQFDMIFNQGLDSVIGVQTVYDNSRELAELPRTRNCKALANNEKGICTIVFKTIHWNKKREGCAGDVAPFTRLKV